MLSDVSWHPHPHRHTQRLNDWRSNHNSIDWLVWVELPIRKIRNAKQHPHVCARYGRLYTFRYFSVMSNRTSRRKSTQKRQQTNVCIDLLRSTKTQTNGKHKKSAAAVCLEVDKEKCSVYLYTIFMMLGWSKFIYMRFLFVLDTINIYSQEH